MANIYELMIVCPGDRSVGLADFRERVVISFPDRKPGDPTWDGDGDEEARLCEAFTDLADGRCVSLAAYNRDERAQERAERAADCASCRAGMNDDGK